jgi:hypothetical protein
VSFNVEQEAKQASKAIQPFALWWTIREERVDFFRDLLTRLRDETILAERERCARLDPHSVKCPICGAEIGYGCKDGCPRFQRFAAAILEDPSDDTGGASDPALYV